MTNFYQDFPDDLFAINGMIQNRAELLQSLLLKQKAHGEWSSKNPIDKKKLVQGICRVPNSSFHNLASYFMGDHGDEYYTQLHKLISDYYDLPKPTAKEHVDIKRLRELAGLKLLYESLKYNHKRIPIKEIFNGYEDNSKTNEGVYAYDGKLNIRPPYQREFVYTGDRREKVIQNILKKRFIGNVTWIKKPDKTFELLDGQQRISSVCQYMNNDFIVDGRYWHSLPADKKEIIENTKIHVAIISDANPSEIIEIFRDINFAGLELTEQELRNAGYAGYGGWLEDAKEFFSKTNSPGYTMSKRYIKGKPDRQEILEIALKWITNSASDGAIRDYMAKNCKKEKATELKEHFEKVISWIEDTFQGDKRKELKSVNWNKLYRMHENNELSPICKKSEIEVTVSRLMQEDDIVHKGIYEYVLTGDERVLQVRNFPQHIKRAVFERQGGKCALCGDEFEDMEGMHADHKKPWSAGGKTDMDNCRMLCADCNIKVSDDNRHRVNPENTPSPPPGHKDHPEVEVTKDQPKPEDRPEYHKNTEEEKEEEEEYKPIAKKGRRRINKKINTKLDDLLGRRQNKEEPPIQESITENFIKEELKRLRVLAGLD